MSDIKERRLLSNILESCAALANLTCPSAGCQECAQSAEVYQQAMESAWGSLVKLDSTALDKARGVTL